MAGGAKANERDEAFRSNIEQCLATQGGLMPFSLGVGGGQLTPALIEAFRCTEQFGAPGWFDRDVTLGRTIFGTPLTAYFVFCRQGWQQPLALWGKCQEDGGSVDQKLPYIFENIQRCRIPACLLLAGKGILDREPVLEYVRHKSSSPGSNIRRVFYTIDEFRNWCSDGMPELPPVPAHGLFAVTP